MFSSSSLKHDAYNAWRVIQYRPVLSALSGLGIAIGTTALVTMMSISEGARQQAEEAILVLGIDTVRLEAKIPENSAFINEQNIAQGLTRNDLNILSRNLPLATLAAWQRFDEQVVHSDSGISQTTILRVTPNWFNAEKITISDGRAISPLDGQHAAQVCVVGREIAVERQLALLDFINWKNISCRVIGVQPANQPLLGLGTALSPIDLNRVILMPLAEPMIEARGIDGITLRLNLNDPTLISQQSEDIEKILNATHRSQDYVVVSPLALLEKAEQEQRTFSIIMGTIAGLSLLVGGIGIMNVMLANVAEQRREIGLRLACGARRIDIIRLYLIHAGLLCSAGTLAGVAIGIVGGFIIQWVVAWPVHFSLFGLAIGPLWALLCGLVFGAYPAKLAADIPPTDALRMS